MPRRADRASVSAVGEEPAATDGTGATPAASDGRDARRPGEEPAAASGGRKGRRRWAIVGGALAILALGGLVGWQALMRFFTNQYYHNTYAPAAVEASALGEYPPRYHLSDVPWLSTREAYCAASSLRMVAAQQGIDVSVQEVSFLMGFTYGAASYSAREMPGGVGFSPFTDPESGHAAAAPYLGLIRRYYVTGDPKLYLRALRFWISRGYAVRAPLDMAVLYDLPGPLPHSDLLVGYDEGGFYNYETVCLEGTPCQPGELPAGQEGLYVSDDLLLRAVLSQAKEFRYPWRYAATIFERAPRQEDLGPAWERNGQLLLGRARYGPAQGADAIEAVAAQIEKRGAAAELEGLLPMLKGAAVNRRDNAAFLQQRFAGQPEVQRAAEAMARAAEAYQGALELARDGLTTPDEAARMADLLRQAAQAEREAGQSCLRQAGDQGTNHGVHGGLTESTERKGE